jgi:hypothetical protein
MDLVAPVVADAFRKIKDYNEVLLARELYDAIDTNEQLMRPLRDIGDLALGYIVQLRRSLKTKSPDAFQRIERVFEDEKSLKIWGEGPQKDVSASRLIALWKQGDTLGANDVSEILRLLGGVVEKASQGTRAPEASPADVTDEVWQSKVDYWNLEHAPALGELEEMRRAYRTALGPGVSDDLWKAGADKGPKHESRPFTSDVRKRDQAWQHPDTGDVQLIDPADRSARQGLLSQGYQLRPLTPEQRRYAMLSDYDESHPESGVRGMTLWDLKEGSTVWAIDRLFGLPPGADISGTTADLMWALETMASLLYPPKNGKRTDLAGNDLKGVLPLLYLLPIAAMVSHYHHTILECALTQTLNGTIEYAVGFYTTLLPPDVEGETARGIRQILQKWEDHPTNFKMIFFDEGTRGLWGVICTTPAEIAAFRTFATVNYTNYATIFAPLKDRPALTLLEIKRHIKGLDVPDLTRHADNLHAAMVDRLRVEKVLHTRTKTVGR